MRSVPHYGSPAMTATDTTDRSGGLLAWQWRLYTGNHRDRRNLTIHAITNPLFLGGTLALASAVVNPLGAIGGIVAMIAAIAVQGRGHRMEREAPVPFRGPLDVVARIFVEQWVTFPRFVLSGGFARAWRESENSRS